MSLDFAKLRSIFEQAVGQPTADWPAVLDAACKDDADLRRGVEQLLEAHAHGGSALDHGPIPATDQTLERLGSQIGPYKLLEQIGEGGFGVVFMAEQTEPVRRKVALKVLKPGMDTRQVVARFEAERQALAIMDHPNIAKVFDGGVTPSGRPFFVMELVKGVPITEFCDQNHLTPRQRLELFVSVCQAIQHAHQNCIIHRDLKPSNILVVMHDVTPVPKVIDFGIAKALGQELTEKTLFTGFAQMVGTPLYMSPEQAGESGLDIDTRSDIYSLGVLLYELLTGTTPFDGVRLQRAAYDELRRIIREEEPPRPSTRLSESKEKLPSISALRQTEPATLTRFVRGELDWVVMKALEKDRTRRYETATALASDLRRYLADEPVMACPPSAGYRFQKFVRRNKGPALAATLVLTTLVGGIVGTTWGLVRAERARRAEAARAQGERRAKEEAQRRLSQVEKGTEILASMFQDLDPIAAEKAGTTARELMSRRLAEAAQQLEGEAVGEPLIVAQLQHLLGISLRELDRPDQAEKVLVKALRTRERLLGAAHLDAIASKHQLAQLYRDQRKFALAENLFHEVAAIREARLGADHLDTLATKHHLAVLYRYQEKYALAEALGKEVLAIRTTRLGADDLDTLATKHNLAVLYRSQGKYAAAEALFKDILPIRSAKLGASHPDNLRTRHHLALLYRSQGEYALAESLYNELVAGLTATLGASAADTLDRQLEWASLYLDQGKTHSAELLYKAMLANCTANLGPGHADTVFCRDTLATFYRSMNLPDRSIPLLEDSLELMTALLGSDDPEILGRQVTLGVNCCEAGLQSAGRALRAEGGRQGRQAPHPAWVRRVLLTAYVQAGKNAPAAALVMDRVRDARHEFAADAPKLAAALAENGKVLLDVKAYDDAELLLLDGYRTLKQSKTTPEIEDGALRDALERLVQLYDAWGKPEQAARWRKELELAVPSTVQRLSLPAQ